MRTASKFGMLAGASVAALGLALAAAPAAAFDEVGWTWSSDVTTDVDLDWDFDPNQIDLDNLGMVEDLQIFIGSVEAESEVTDIYNNQPNEAVDTGGAVLVEFSHALDLDGTGANVADAESRFWIGPNGTLLDSNGDPLDNTQLTTLQASLVDAATDSDDANGSGYILVEVDGEIIPIDSFNALTELPEVVSAATAVANNASVEAEFGDGNNDGGGLLLHEGQFAFDVPEGGVNADWNDAAVLAGVYNELSSMNSGLVISGLATSATLLDLLDHSEIEAESEVDRVLNSTVDSAATAVANNFSGELVAEDSSMLIGDVTQFALANVEAESEVDDVWLHDYTNLGRLDRPIVNSVATAVGNNKSISITVGDIDPTE